MTYKNAGSAFRRFWKDHGGSSSLISIMSAIPVVAAAGMGIDYSRSVRAKTEIQEVADAAALAAASGKNISGSVSAKQLARKNIASKYITDSLAKVSDVEILGTPEIITGPNTVDVSINARVKGTFLNVLNALPSDAVLGTGGGGTVAGDTSYDFDFNVHTKVGFSKDSYMCLLSLNPSKQEAIYFQGNSEFMASVCTVQANSNNATAMRTWGSAYAEAEDFCSVGGWAGSGFEPDPASGCSSKLDPYRSLVMPTVGACTYTNKLVKNATAALTPGVYCGGLELKTHGVANLAPGLYVIKDGDLKIDAQSTLNAPSGVTIYLTGNVSNLDITSGASLTINAPTAATAIASTSAYKSFAIMQDRTTGIGNINYISSGGAVNIVGAIYTPKQNLTVWANGAMNSTSPYFPMVVDSLNMSGNATLYVKLDYALASFPEPVELKTKSKVHLTQ